MYVYRESTYNIFSDDTTNTVNYKHELNNIPANQDTGKIP